MITSTDQQLPHTTMRVAPDDPENRRPHRPNFRLAIYEVNGATRKVDVYDLFYAVLYRLTLPNVVVFFCVTFNPRAHVGRDRCNLGV